MLREALQYIVGGFAPVKWEVNGQTYSNHQMHLVRRPLPDALQIWNLSGLVDYLKDNYDALDPVLIQVSSPTEVNVFSTFNGDRNRDHYLIAKAQPPAIPFGKFMDLESFNILLQSCFVDNEDRATLLRVVGNVRDDNVAQFGDDGVSQQVTVKSGIAQVEAVKVPNPVVLKPFRTFVDVPQPESQYVFRMTKGPTGPTAALFEADGGAWKLAAIQGIKNYLMEHLIQNDSAEKGFTTIIA